MPTYRIGMSRTYLITIQAENIETAKSLTNLLFEPDLSISDDRERYKIALNKVELLENDVFECDNVED